jgi:hypothetical protein
MPVVRPVSLQVSQSLCFVHRGERFDGLELEGESTSDDEIQSVAKVQVEPLVDNRYGALMLERQVPQLEFVRETLLIGRFEQPWAKGSMDLDAGRNDLLRTIPKSSRLPAFLPHAGRIAIGAGR